MNKKNKNLFDLYIFFIGCIKLFLILYLSMFLNIRCAPNRYVTENTNPPTRKRKKVKKRDAGVSGSSNPSSAEILGSVPPHYGNSSAI